LRLRGIGAERLAGLCAGADDAEERLRVGAVHVDRAAAPHRKYPFFRLFRLWIAERRPKIIADSAHHVELLERVVRCVSPAIGLCQKLIERVLDAGARGRGLREVARERLLVDVGPIDDRRTDRHAIVEVAGRWIFHFEERVVLQRRHEAHELARETNVRDVVRRSEVDVDLRVFIDHRDFEIAAGHSEIFSLRQFEPDRIRIILRALIVVERRQDSIGKLPHGKLRRLPFQKCEKRRDRLAHRRLGRDQKPRQIDRASRHVLGLNRIARGHGAREGGARI